MQTLKRIWPLFRLLFSVMSLVGCTSLVTLPFTAAPLFALSVFILLFAPHLSEFLVAVWRALTTVVNVQSLFFALMIGYTFLTEVFDVLTGSLQLLVSFDPHQSAASVYEERRRAMRRHLWIGALTAAVAAIPAGFLLGGYYLWSMGSERLGIVLQLVGIISQLALLIAMFRLVTIRTSPRQTLW